MSYLERVRRFVATHENSVGNECEISEISEISQPSAAPAGEQATVELSTLEPPSLADTPSPVAAFEQLSAERRQSILIGVEDLHRALVHLFSVQEEIGVVAAHCGFQPLQDALDDPTFCDLLNALWRPVIEMRHLVGIDGGACGRPACRQAPQHGSAFLARVAEVYDLLWVIGGLREDRNLFDKEEVAAKAYEDVVMDAYRRDSGAAA